MHYYRHNSQKNILVLSDRDDTKLTIKVGFYVHGQNLLHFWKNVNILYFLSNREQYDKNKNTIKIQNKPCVL